MPNLKKPYVPSFSITPARITEPAVGALVWALHNRHLHILAYGGSGSDTMTSRALITSVLEPARLHGAEWIDLALPRRFDAWFDGLAKLPGVDVAIEERIALRHPIVN